jgi:hypothetical protein
LNLDIRICLEFSAWDLEFQLGIAETVPTETRKPTPRNDISMLFIRGEATQ